ncbi:MAG: hypothetical protein P4M11_12525 [Candidatus Pacebacteria bacterium]|nr:hypothetical protein [Candidatus Paceibacterota bacterium]
MSKHLIVLMRGDYAFTENGLVSFRKGKLLATSVHFRPSPW